MKLRSADALRAPQLMLLLLATLGVAALVAFEAEGDVGAHRATAERALGDYLAVVGREAVNATANAVAADATAMLAPAAGTRASSPYDVLPGPDVLERRAAATFACPADVPNDAGQSFVRLDLRDATLAVAGTPVGAAASRWLRDALTAVVAGGDARATAPGAIPVGVLFGRGAFAGRVVVYGVKRAPFDAPIAVYGVVTCIAALGQPLVVRVAREPALVAALSDSLLVVRTGDAAAPGASSSAPVAQVRVGGLLVRAWPGPGARRRLLVRPGRGPRLALLAVLAAVTATLVLAALAQLGREQELVRLRADFTSSVSHELRTPLAQILLYGETLALGRARGEGDRRAAAETIVREARRLMQMVENVLYVARAERRANGVRPTIVALEPLALDVAVGFAPLAAAAGATVAVDVPAALAVRAEPGALRQVLLNLLDNAVRYGRPGQVVRVGGLASGDVVRLTVDDDGPGVPPRDRERIWAPFVRLARDRVTSDGARPRRDGARPGSGLGLAVVRDLVALHGGRAWVEDAPGAGARFVIELPAASIEPSMFEPAADPRTRTDFVQSGDASARVVAGLGRPT